MEAGAHGGRDARVSVTVMAHPKRVVWAEHLAEQLECGITFDRHNNVWDTARRAWLAHNPNATHHLVIQDDAILCRDLTAAAAHIARLYPAQPVTLTAIGYRLANLRPAYDAARRAGLTFFHGRRAISTVALMVPTGSIIDMIRWCDSDRSRHDDVRIMRYWKRRNIDTAFTIPSLVDHRDVHENPTLVEGNDRSWKTRSAVNFIGADRSALEVDWRRADERRVRSKEAGSMVTATFARVGNPEQTATVEVGSASYRRLKEKLSRHWTLVAEEIPDDVPEPSVTAPTVDVTTVDDVEPVYHDAPNVDDFHLGAGWYALPDGTKVRGRDAAEQAMA